MEVDGEGPSLPANYVNILQLKERWLQQQQNPPKSNPNHSQSNPNPNHDESATEIPNKPNSRTKNRNRHRVINRLKPQVSVDDSASKTLAHVAGNHQNGEKQEDNNDRSNSKLDTKKNPSRDPKPRSVADQNPPPLLQLPQPAEEKKHVGRRRSGNQKVVREPEDKTPPFVRHVERLSHNDARRDAVKESNVSNVSQGTNRRGGSGRFHGVSRFGSKKGQVFVWVKKGESAPN